MSDEPRPEGRGEVALQRERETGTDCLLCEHGHVVYCPACFIDQVSSYRTVLRQAGTPIGEPAAWP